MVSMVGSKSTWALLPLSTSTTPSTVKFVRAVPPPLICKLPKVPLALLVASAFVPCSMALPNDTPGIVCSIVNRSRPFTVMFSICELSISFEFSLEEVCTGVAAAVTETSSVRVPSSRLILPRSRRSFGVMSMFLCAYVLKPALGVIVRS